MNSRSLSCANASTLSSPGGALQAGALGLNGANFVALVMPGAPSSAFAMLIVTASAPTTPSTATSPHFLLDNLDNIAFLPTLALVDIDSIHLRPFSDESHAHLMYRSLMSELQPRCSSVQTDLLRARIHEGGCLTGHGTDPTPGKSRVLSTGQRWHTPSRVRVPACKPFPVGPSGSRQTRPGSVGPSRLATSLDRISAPGLPCYACWERWSVPLDA